MAGANNNDPITINVEVRQIVVGYGSTPLIKMQEAKSQITLENFLDSVRMEQVYVCD